MGGGGRRKAGGQEDGGLMDAQTDMMDLRRPRVVKAVRCCGIAVMLMDAWLFASAFTVDTKKHRKEKKHHESK